jgi:hypothetical protein
MGSLQGRYMRNQPMRGGDKRKTTSYYKKTIDVKDIQLALRKAKKQYGEDIYVTFNINS